MTMMSGVLVVSLLTVGREAVPVPVRVSMAQASSASSATAGAPAAQRSATREPALVAQPSAPARPAAVAAPASGDVVKEARALIDRGQARAAVEKLEPLKASADPKVRHLLGVAYYHADAYQQAVDILLPLRDQFPADSIERREAEQVLGFALHLLGRDADAIPWLERTRTHTPDSTELNFILGQAYIQTRQPAPAREAIARTFNLPPASAAASIVAATQMIRLQMEPLAEAELLRALEIDAKIPRANFLLGQLALFRGQLDEAIARSQRELTINPSDAMALYQIGDAYTRQSKWDEAIRVLQQSMWLNPFYSGTYILLGRSYLKKAQPATAEGMLRRAIDYDPNNRTAHYLLAQLLQQTDRMDEAAREFAIAERLQGQSGRP
jgi:tetratricopeptide (TPR) repeat protein